MSEKDEKEAEEKEKPLDPAAQDQEPENVVQNEDNVSQNEDDVADHVGKQDVANHVGKGDVSNHVGKEDTAATIDHETVQIDFTNKVKEVDSVEGENDHTPAVISTQPTVMYGYDQTVTIDGTATPVIKQGPRKPKPKDFVVTSCFVVLCCNFIFGLIGYHYGVKANHAWQLGDEPCARKRSKLALIMVICGIVAGLATYALAFGLYFSMRDKDDPYLQVHHNNMAG